MDGRAEGLTPIGASAEIELNVMTRQCLKRRIDNLDKLRFELVAWVRDRNSAKQKINWQFTTEDSRVKHVSLYRIGAQITRFKQGYISFDEFLKRIDELKQNVSALHIKPL